MKKENLNDAAKEMEVKNVSSPVRALVAFFFIFISFLLVWFMRISFLISPFFLLIVALLSLVYYTKDQMRYLVVLSVLVIGYFLVASIPFPYCDSYFFGGILPEYRASCDCSGIKKKISLGGYLGGYESETQCIGVRKKCYKHPYDFSKSGRGKVEIPCSSVEREAQKIKAHEDSGGLDEDMEEYAKEREKTLPKLDYKRGTQKELEKYQTSENFINIENIDGGVSFLAVYDGRDCVDENYRLSRTVAERTIRIAAQGSHACKEEIVKRVVRGTITNLNPGKYKFKLDYTDFGPPKEKWRKKWRKPIVSTVLEKEFEVE